MELRRVSIQPSKQRAREQIERDMQAFLESGGEVTVAPPPVFNLLRPPCKYVAADDGAFTLLEAEAEDFLGLSRTALKRLRALGFAPEHIRHPTRARWWLYSIAGLRSWKAAQMKNPSPCQITAVMAGLISTAEAAAYAGVSRDESHGYRTINAAVDAGELTPGVEIVTAAGKVLRFFWRRDLDAWMRRGL